MIYIRMYVGMSVCMYVGLSTKNMYAEMRGWNYVAKTRACSKSSFWGISHRQTDIPTYIHIYIYIYIYTRKWFPLQGELAP